MKSFKYACVAVSAALAMSGAAVVLSASAQAVTTPASAITNDPNASNGSIQFYDSSGNVITGGNDLSKVFTYAAASSAGRTGTTKATVYFSFPDSTKPNSTTWFQKQVTASTSFPDSTAPAPVNGLSNPVARADNGQADLAVMLPTTTQDHTAGYDGIVQVRLRDSGPGIAVQTAPFWATDIYFDATAGTWQQVYPAAATASTTVLTASPAGHAPPGTSIVITATVSPSAAAGSVAFLVDGTSAGAAVPVSSGVASISTSTLPAGPHTFRATFTPTDTTAYTASTSADVSYVVADVPDAPTNVHATAGNGSVVVSYTAPANSNGRPVNGYDVQYSSNNGATWTSASSDFHTSRATTHTIGGLHNGTTYVLRVAAINSIGKGAYSAKSSAVKPVADGSSITISRPTTVRYGSALRISGTLTDTKTRTKISGATAVLYFRHGTSGAFTRGPASTSTSTGAVTAIVKPTSTTYYEWKYAGSATHGAATSALDKVSVSQVVTLAATPSKVTHGKVFKLFGAVAPSAANLKVTLQVRSGATYKTVATTTTKRQKLPNGRTTVGYVFSVKEARKATYTFRVTRAATSTLLAGISASVSVKVV